MRRRRNQEQEGPGACSFGSFLHTCLALLGGVSHHIMLQSMVKSMFMFTIHVHLDDLPNPTKSKIQSVSALLHVIVGGLPIGFPKEN